MSRVLSTSRDTVCVCVCVREGALSTYNFFEHFCLNYILVRLLVLCSVVLSFSDGYVGLSCTSVSLSVVFVCMLRAIHSINLICIKIVLFVIVIREWTT